MKSTAALQNLSDNVSRYVPLDVPLGCLSLDLPSEGPKRAIGSACPLLTGDMLMFKGETTRAQINANGGIHGKELAIQEMQPMLRAIGGLTLLFIGFYIYRNRKQPLDALVHFAVIPFFCMTNPQINYYNLRLVLVMWHGARLDKPFHKVALARLFGIEAVAHYLQGLGVERYTVTSATSIGLFVYMLMLMGYMGFHIARSYGLFEKGKKREETPPEPKEASSEEPAGSEPDGGESEATEKAPPTTGEETDQADGEDTPEKP